MLIKVTGYSNEKGAENMPKKPVEEFKMTNSRSCLKMYCICTHWKTIYYVLIRISCSFTKWGKIGNPSEKDLVIIGNHI